MRRPTARALGGLAVATLLSACEPSAWRDDRLPPFRTEAFGSGLETSSSGRRVDLVDTSGALVARFRVSSTGMRVYDAGAAQVGRIRLAERGWLVERVDGTTACSLGVDDDTVRVVCGALTLTVVRDEGGWSVHAGERVLARVGPLEGGGVGLTYDGSREPEIRFQDGQLSVRTHADARQWLRTDPVSWDPVVLVLTRIQISDVPPADLPLVRGALAFGMSRLLGVPPSY